MRHEVQGLRFKVDDLVKSRHSGEPRIWSGAGTGVQSFCNFLNNLDSGFHRNDARRYFTTFYRATNGLDYTLEWMTVLYRVLDF